MYLLNLLSRGAVRLGKFINLVKNEYIKMSLKKSTWIMLIILLIGCIGYPFAVKFAEYQLVGDNYSDSEEYSIDDYKEQIAYLKDVKTEGWENEVECIQYKIDNNITSGWKIGAADEMFNVKYNSDESYKFSQEQTDNYVNSMASDIESGNWKGYFQTAVELMDAKTVQDAYSQGSKEMYQYCLDNDIRPDESNWKYKTVVEMKNAESEIKNLDESKKSGVYVDSNEYKNYEEIKVKSEYRLQNNIKFDISENTSWINSGEFNFWSVFCTTTMICSFIGLLVIIIAGGIVSSEFSGGTIKFLLINPVKRWKILVSKYVTTITFGYILIIITYIISAVMSLTVFGADNLSASFISVSDGVVKEIPGFLYVFNNYMLGSVEIVVMSSLAFAISSVARSSALAIGISVMAYFGGNTVMLILSQLNISWARYLIWANVDLSGIMEGSGMFMGQTLTSAFAVIAVHMVIFLMIAWDGFTRREV